MLAAQSLPLELVCIVFTFLPFVDVCVLASRVCVLWATAALDPRSTSVLTLSSDEAGVRAGEAFDDELLAFLSPRLAFLKTIRIRGHRGLHGAGLLYTLYRCGRRLERLILHNCTQLSFSQYIHAHAHAYAHAHAHAHAHAPDNGYAVAIGCGGSGGRSRGASQQCRAVVPSAGRVLSCVRIPHLRTLELDGCDSLNDGDLRIVARMIGRCSNEHCNEHSTGDSLDGLTELSLARLEDITDRGVLALQSEACLHGLTRLCLNSAYSVSARAVTAVVAQCSRHLRCLELSECRSITGNQVLFDILPLCPALVVVDLSGLRGFTAHSSNATRSNNSNNSNQLSSRMRYPELRRLSLRGCYDVTNRVAASFLLLPAMSTLTHVDFSYCVQLTDSFMQEFFAAHAALIGVHAINLRLLTDDAFAALGKGSCSKLSSLVIDGCERVSDVALNYIVAGCPLLRTLSIKGCYDVTSQGVRRFPRSVSVQLE